MQGVVDDFKAGLIQMPEAVQKIKDIAVDMELMEAGQRVIGLDKPTA